RCNVAIALEKELLGQIERDCSHDREVSIVSGLQRPDERLAALQGAELLGGCVCVFLQEWIERPLKGVLSADGAQAQKTAKKDGAYQRAHVGHICHLASTSGEC